MSDLNSTTIESLPNELLFDILVRLPADFLHHKARLVCRRWCRIIRSDAFINTHLQRSTYGLLLSSLPHSVYVTATQGGQIVTSEMSEVFRRIRIRAICNGLAVEFFDINAGDKSLSLHVVNPATKQSFRLPSLSTQDRIVSHDVCCIAYCAASMEYKVTLHYYDFKGKCWCLDIVTVGVDKSWRRVEIPHLPKLARLAFWFPIIGEGFLHWGSDRYCLTMNVETDEIITMTEFPIPRDQCFDHSYYLSTGRYITLFVNRLKESSWEVWEMRPPESGEWRKAMLPNIDLEPHKCKLLRQQFGYDDYEHYLKPVGWVKYPEVLAFSFGRLVRTCIFYNLETHEINAIELGYHQYNDYRALVHRNSLVWLTEY